MKPTYLTAHTGKPRVTLSRPAFDLALAGALAFLAWLLVSQAAHAATESTEFRCVSDSAQLADALLNNTQSPNVNIAIRVRQGTYTVSGINATFAAPMSIRG